MSNNINRSSLSRALECARALSNQTLVRPREAAAMLGISRKHLYALANRPDFPERVRISDRVVAWRVSDLSDGSLEIGTPISTEQGG